MNTKQTKPAQIDETLDLDTLQNSALLNDIQTAKILGLKTHKTLAVWRCNKRYQLPFIKVGRLIRYRAGDLKQFLASRTQ